MKKIVLLNKSPLCLTVDSESSLIDAGLALAAQRSAQAGADSRRLGDLVDLVRQTVNPKATKHAKTVFQYIDLAEVNEDLGSILSYRVLKGELVGSSKSKFQKGDILFAKIRPSIDNKKVALVFQDLDNAIASTEFLVLRPKNDADREYLFAALRADQFTNSVVDACSGDTGRQRIAPETLLTLTVPWPEKYIREAVALKVRAYFNSLADTMAFELQAREFSQDAVGATNLRTSKPRRKRSKA